MIVHAKAAPCTCQWQPSRIIEGSRITKKTITSCWLDVVVTLLPL